MASLLVLSLCVGMISAFQDSRVLGPTYGSKLGTTGRRVPTMSMSEAPSATTFDMDLAIALGARDSSGSDSGLFRTIHYSYSDSYPGWRGLLGTGAALAGSHASASAMTSWQAIGIKPTTTRVSF